MASNPDIYLQNLLGNNPALSQIVNGGNYKDIFFNLCKERGIDPQTIIGQFR